MVGTTLRDLGERRVVDEILAPRYASETRFGDDCASVSISAAADELVVATTDPCPPPVATALGFNDLFYTGWLLATLNLSDLAAAGARPLGLLTSLTLPSETPVTSFERLLDGIDECCAAVDTKVLGGNLKEAAQLDVSATALGTCSRSALLTRNGARPGDRILVVGDLGSFWAGTLAVREGLIAADDLEHPLLANVLTPLPKVAPMRVLAETGLLRAAIDNSDGLYPSLVQLVAPAGHGAIVEADGIAFADIVREMSEQLAIDPIRLALGWGDWQVIAVCDPASTDEVRSVAASFGVDIYDIGQVTERSGVLLSVGGAEGVLMPLDSERFADSSWFSSGLDGYIEALCEAPLATALQP